MGKRGPKPKPQLQVVREGNPGKRPLREDVQLPPAELLEPRWATLMPLPADLSQRREIEHARRVASEIWRRVHARLKPAGLISDVDADQLAELGVVRAQMWIKERRWFRGEEDKSLPSLAQLRVQFNMLAARFYMTPGDRANVDLGGGKDDDDADFDRPADTARGGR